MSEEMSQFLTIVSEVPFFVRTSAAGFMVSKKHPVSTDSKKKLLFCVLILSATS
jgi:hypothetical protein